MRNEKILIKLIDYCVESKVTLLNYHIGGGVLQIPDTATVINSDGGCFDLAYNINSEQWVDKTIYDTFVKL